MNDKQSAAIILGMFTVAFILWYRKQGEEKRTALFGGGGTGVSGASPSAAQAKDIARGGIPRLPNASGYNPDLDLLRAFAQRHKLFITSETEGRHNPGSLHYQGRAVDVRSRGMTDAVVESLRKAAASFGILLRDERRRPAGQKVWGGPHVHLEVPR